MRHTPPIRRTAPALGWLARRGRELLEPLIARPGRDSAGVPPRRLRARTGAPGAREFLHGGSVAADELQDALRASLGRSFADFSTILDFGCGSARVLPHVAALASAARCHGCDVDPAAIAWGRRRYPQLNLRSSSFSPPLPYAAGTHELVYSISVFSHLDEGWQDAWLAELHRVLVAGGVALLSVHGHHALEQFRTGAVRTRWCRPEAFARPPLSASEFVFEPYLRSIWNRADLPGTGAGYGLAFHGDGYLRSRWRAYFDVVTVLPRAITAWQDLAVLVKRSQEPGAPNVELSRRASCRARSVPRRPAHGWGPIAHGCHPSVP
ncbi:MAG: class I SAM-dependent methyltransferase [Solirubrobacteraceae bacterium]